jgi:hypothetical protein
MSGIVRLSLAVYSGESQDLDLYTLDLVADFLPTPGNRVPLWVDPDEDGEGQLWHVEHVYWRRIGFRLEPVVVLRGMWIDPPKAEPGVLSDCYKLLGREPWWTDSRGDARELLIAAGWARA